jgi:hypothetical protein
MPFSLRRGCCRRKNRGGSHAAPGTRICVKSTIAYAARHIAFAFRRHATIGGAIQFPDTPNLAFVEMKFPGASNVNFDAILTDPAFRVAAEQHLSSQLARFISIRVGQSKIIQIQGLIDQELGVAATSTEDSF